MIQKNSKLGIPYMGSKRKLAKDIVKFILDQNPNVKYVYDLFGGGGAITFEFLQHPQIKQVVYNELNTGVTELLKKIKTDGVTEEFYQWVDRDTFKKYKNDNTWLGGLIKTCWSFGNGQSSYLYGKDKERDKYLLHKIIVDDDTIALGEFNNKHGFNIQIPKHKTINAKRLDITGQIKKHTRVNLQHLEMLEHLQRLQHLERLQQLERLENFERLQHLEIENKSYEQVAITTPPEETIIYLDPPYINTGKYQCDIDHEKLYEYIRNSNYKIYMSSYEAPFECVLELEHISTLSATNINKQVVEKLFSNRKHNNR